MGGNGEERLGPGLGLKELDNFDVRRRKDEFPKVKGAHPSDLFTLKGMGFPCYWNAFKYMKGDLFGLVLMMDRQKPVYGPDLQSQLLLHLPFEARLQGFALLLFASRKLPEPPEMRLRPALCDENLPVFPDQTSSDMKMTLPISLYPQREPL